MTHSLYWIFSYSFLIPSLLLPYPFFFPIFHKRGYHLLHFHHYSSALSKIYPQNDYPHRNEWISGFPMDYFKTVSTSITHCNFYIYTLKVDKWIFFAKRSEQFPSGGEEVHLIVND